MSPHPKVASFKVLSLLPPANCPTPLPFRLLAVWRTGQPTFIGRDPSVGVAYEAGSGAITLSLIGVASLGYAVLVSMI
jgi:hypothetical protein